MTLPITLVHNSLCSIIVHVQDIPQGVEHVTATGLSSYCKGLNNWHLATCIEFLLYRFKIQQRINIHSQPKLLISPTCKSWFKNASDYESHFTRVHQTQTFCCLAIDAKRFWNGIAVPWIFISERLVRKWRILKRNRLTVIVQILLSNTWFTTAPSHCLLCGKQGYRRSHCMHNSHNLWPIVWVVLPFELCALCPYS